MGCTISNKRHGKYLCFCFPIQGSQTNIQNNNKDNQHNQGQNGNNQQNQQQCNQYLLENIIKTEQECKNFDCDKKEQEKEKNQSKNSAINCDSNISCPNKQADTKQSEGNNLKLNQDQQQQKDLNLNIDQRNKSQTIGNIQNENNIANQQEKENQKKDPNKKGVVDANQIIVEEISKQEKNKEPQKQDIGNQVQQNKQINNIQNIPQNTNQLEKTPIQNQINQQPNNPINPIQFQSNSLKCVFCKEFAQIQLNCLHYYCSSCIKIQILETCKGEEENLKYIKCKECQNKITQQNIEEILGGKYRLKEILEQQMKQIKDQAQYHIECKCCNQEIRIGKGVTLSNCNHLFCEKCIKSYIEQKINNGEDLAKLICPLISCRISINPNQVNDLFYNNLQLIEDYRFLQIKNATLDRDQKIIKCPNQNCSNWFGVYSKANQVVCQKCQTKICVICSKNFHQDKSCQQFSIEQQILKNLQQQQTQVITYLPQVPISRQLQKCPQCQKFIQNLEDCQCKIIPQKPKNSICKICSLEIGVCPHSVY